MEITLIPKPRERRSVIDCEIDVFFAEGFDEFAGDGDVAVGAEVERAVDTGSKIRKLSSPCGLGSRLISSSMSSLRCLVIFSDGRSMVMEWMSVPFTSLSSWIFMMLKRRGDEAKRFS